MSEARLSNAFQRLVEKITSRTDYHALYPATILKCHGDLHLDVQPDSDKLPQFTRLPVRIPWPGLASLKVQPGGRCLIAFTAGNPAKPYIHQFETGTLEHLKFATGQGLTVELDDDRDNAYAVPTIRITDGSSTVLMQPKQLVMDIQAAGDATVTAAGNAIITAEKILLGTDEDGPQVARVGDEVTVGSAKGSITGGSEKVLAG